MRLLVRHAHAGDKRNWTGRDAERPLSVLGWQHAEGLRDTLADVPVRRLLTSPTLRCRQTLLPLAAGRRLEVQPVDALGVDGDVDQLAGLLTAPGNGGTVWCTHGEVLGVLLARLHARGVIHPDPPAGSDRWLRYEKGSAWLLEGHPGGGFRARYLPPRTPRPELAGRLGDARAQLGRRAIEQQRLLARIAELTGTTRRLAARLERQQAAAAAVLDQARQTARAVADARARLEETRRALLDRLLAATGPALPAPPARMVAGLTDVGALLVSAAGQRPRRHPERQWVVLADQPLAVRAQPGLVERLLGTVLEAASHALPPADPTWVVARATATAVVVAIAADPTAVPFPPQGLPRQGPTSAHQAGTAAVDAAVRLAEQVGGQLTLTTHDAGGVAAAASRLLLRLPLAAPPDEVWPDQPAYPVPPGGTTSRCRRPAGHASPAPGRQQRTAQQGQPRHDQ